MMLTPEQYRKLIEDSVASVDLPAEPRGLYDPIRYALDAGGKRLRPLLTLAAAEALGLDPRRAINQALAVETFHNFTLLHDDIMDRAEMRRGRPAVHVKWNDNTAILSGDAMLTFAGILLARDSGGELDRLLPMFSKTAMEVYEGQQYDVDFESRTDVTVDEYINMIYLKTSVLLGCACALGAIRAGAGEERVNALYGFGAKLGLAFQLQDDWLDTYGDPVLFGKNIGGDIANDKKTWLLITALGEAPEVSGWIGRNDNPAEKYRCVRGVYDRLNLSERCHLLMERYVEEALVDLRGAGLGADAERFFITLAGSLSTRKN